MARIEKRDISLNAQLDEMEQRISLLKMQYEKYFTGLEKIEPLKDREALKREVRDLLADPMKNPAQRFRFQQIKARLQSYELYWTRNLVQMERGTHPKMKFRADLKQPKPGDSMPEAAVEPLMSAEQEEVLRRRQELQEREERAYKLVFDKYIEARGKCGQSTDLSFDTMRTVLRQQVRQIKSTFGVESVKFKISVEDGKAKVKAVPVQQDGSPKAAS